MSTSKQKSSSLQSQQSQQQQPQEAKKSKQAAPDSSQQMNEKDILRILIATDNHLGFAERDRTRKDDAFIVFEEILSIAVEKQVDFVLLGGDLFHDNKPSRETLYRTIELFRKYCFGDRAINLQILSDQKVNFGHNNGTVNYEDPNFNIGLPVFAIHGNHDEPCGEHTLSALDVLAKSNLINYFGKTEKMDDIHVKPILIQKGETKLSLYGLGYVRDERLYRTFQQKKIKFYRPKESKDDWFNLFVLHQNRQQHHSRKSTITEAMLRGFFDLVIFGHEHEQLIKPQKSAEGGFEVMQPGSSVVVGLVPEEAKTKKVAVLEVYKDQYRCHPIELQTARPFVMDSLVLSQDPSLDDQKNNVDAIMDKLAQKIEHMIEEAKAKMPPPQILKQYPSLKLPLIRLKVDYTGGYASINPHRFGQRFVDKVANPADVVLFSRKKKTTAKSTSEGKTPGNLALEEMEDENNDDKDKDETSNAPTIDDLVSQYLKEQNNQLSLLSETTLQDAVMDFIHKEEPAAISEFYGKQVQSARKYLWSSSKKWVEEKGAIDNDDIKDLISQFKEQSTDKDKSSSSSQRLADKVLSKKSSKEDNEDADMPDALKESTTSKKKKVASDDDDDDDKPASDNESDAKKKSTRGRGRGRGRGAKAATTSTRKKAAASTSKKAAIKFKGLSDDEEEKKKTSEEEEVQPKKTARGTKRARVKQEKASSGDDEPSISMDKEDDEEPPAKKQRANSSKKAAVINLDSD